MDVIVDVAVRVVVSDFVPLGLGEVVSDAESDRVGCIEEEELPEVDADPETLEEALLDLDSRASRLGL